MIPISPGLAQGAFDMLGIILRQELSAPVLAAAFAKMGGVGSRDVLELAQVLNWVSVGADGLLSLTPTGERLLEAGGYQFRLRQAILDYVEVISPPWLQNATYGRSRVLNFAGGGVAQALVEAGVAEGIGDDIVAFWDHLAAMARGQKDDRLLAIGRTGERLTIAHETARTGASPRWVSIDSNEDGYDVLSILDRDNRAPLAIEVKATTIGLAGAMFLTRHEWERALNDDRHVFHLWDISKSETPHLAVVPSAVMAAHMPGDCGAGLWDGVKVPFAAFVNRFEASLCI